MKLNRKMLLPLGLVAGLAGGALVYSPEKGASFIAQALADPLKVFADRSPGARQPGALTQTKKNKVLEKSLLDHSLIADRPPVVFEPHTHVPPSVDILTPLVPAGVAPVLIDSVDAPQTFLPGIPVYLPGPGGIGFLPGTPSIPGTPGGGGGGTPTNPPVGSVPEPSTWAMLLLGFFAIGGALRRRSESWEGGRSCSE